MGFPLADGEELLGPAPPVGGRDRRATSGRDGPSAVGKRLLHQLHELVAVTGHAHPLGVVADLGEVGAHDGQAQGQVLLELDRVG